MFRFRTVRIPGGVVFIQLRAPGFARIAKRAGLDTLRTARDVSQKGRTMLPANLWCSECRVYYNPRSGKHVCHKAAIDKNRADLERWLTEFTIKED